MTHAHHPLRTNPVLSVFSLALGYAFWLMLAQSQQIELSFYIPICLYNVHEKLIINAPESIRATLAGKRRALYTLEDNDLATHIDAHNITTSGTHTIALRNARFVLKDGIRLVHYTPADLTFTVTQE